MPEPDALSDIAAGHSADTFSCSSRTQGYGAAWVGARGELDLVSAPVFAEEIDRTLRRTLLLVVDLEAVTFIDCAGIHAILDADARARRAGRRVVVIAAGSVGRLFTLLGLTRRLKIVDLSRLDAPGQRAR